MSGTTQTGINRIRQTQEGFAFGAGDIGKAIAYTGTDTFGPLAFEASGAVAAHVALADPHVQYQLESGYTAADVLTKLLTVDIDASGLNATTLQSVTPGATGLVALAAENAAVLRTAAALGTIATETEANYSLVSGTRAMAVSQAQAFTNGVVTGIIAPAVDGVSAVGIYKADKITPLLIGDTTQLFVGINTVPGNRLHVAGPESALVRLQNTTPITGKSYYLRSMADGGFDILHHTGNIVYAIDTTGYIGIGFGASPTSDAGILLFTNSTVGAAVGVKIQNNGSGKIFVANGIGTDFFTIAANGYIAVGSHTPTALLHLAPSTTARAQLRLETQTGTPSSPNVGDMRQDGTNCFMYLAGTWKQLDN